ncbi:ATP-dependent RNA helicase [Phlyctochytrium planicorne]|nr:ATP-dependent RNA helicase [Phlyctochytrium planicorne]
MALSYQTGGALRAPVATTSFKVQKKAKSDVAKAVLSHKEARKAKKAQQAIIDDDVSMSEAEEEQAPTRLTLKSSFKAPASPIASPKVEKPTYRILEDDGNETFSQEVDTLEIEDSLKHILANMGIKQLTRFQAKSIPKLLSGQDLLGISSKTTASTISYLIPAVDFLIKLKFKARNGVGVAVISPNRETALQIFSIAKELFKNLQQTVGLAIEGSDRRSEVERLCKGVNLVIGTPACLLDHLQNTAGFEFSNARIFVVDEVDTICQSGFAKDVRQIRKLLPNLRQHVFFSTVSNEKVQSLALSIARNDMTSVDNGEKDSQATNDKITNHCHTVCPTELKFTVLYNFLSKSLPDKKVIVLFSSSESAKFHAEMLNVLDISVTSIHGDQSLQRRSELSTQFFDADKGVFFCTNVIARNFEALAADWLIQYEPPDSIEEYVSHVRKVSQSGSSLLFLNIHELEFIRRLKSSGVQSDELNLPAIRAEKLQAQIEGTIEKNYMLYKVAFVGYKSYVQVYATSLLKKYFDIEKLEIPKVAKAFGFKVAPRVNY